MFRNGLQPMHIIVVLLVILLVFGSAKLPDLASSIGKSLKIFKKEVKELREDDEAPAQAPQPPTTGPGQAQQPYPDQPYQQPPADRQSPVPGAAPHPGGPAGGAPSGQVPPAAPGSAG